MNKILKALTDVLTFLFANREHIKALQQQITDRDQIIADLQAAIVANQSNDAALIASAQKAEADKKTAEDALAQLNADNAEAEAKADAVAAAITADSAIPISVTPDGAVTAQ